MVLLRKILFPLAVLYGWITQLRNFFYDCGLLKSHAFEVPVIAVGNLSVGGTGKSPMIEYLIRLLASEYKIATLSRGYKRSTEGFVLAGEEASAESIGDEPFQFYRKFGVKDSNPSSPTIFVAVDADRKNGIENLLKQDPKPQIVLLDDAFQHRKVKAGFYILLTAYGDLYADDFMLPTGNLREGRSGAKRANLIVVTKCPPDLSAEAQNQIRQKLKVDSNQQLFFTAIAYDDRVFSDRESMPVGEIKNESKLLLAGIAKPKPFFAYLQRENDAIMEFPDHHHFSDSDIATILNQANNRKIITTEKDYVRLKGRISADRLFYLPIKSAFLCGGENFDQTIKNYVGTSTTNR